MIKLKIGQRMLFKGKFIGIIAEITDGYVVLYNPNTEQSFMYDKDTLIEVLSYSKSGLEIIEEKNKVEQPNLKIKTKNLNIYEVFTLLEKMPEGTLVKISNGCRMFRLNNEELIEESTSNVIEEYYPLKELLFLTFDLVEESEEEKRRVQENKKREKDISDLEKQITDIQNKITLLRLGME